MVYLESADFGSSFSIDVNKGTSIKNMKSSNKNVVKPYYYRINKDIMVNDDGKESSANNDAYAYFRAVKAGKTISVNAVAASGWKVVYMDAYNSTDKYYADFTAAGTMELLRGSLHLLTIRLINMALWVFALEIKRIMARYMLAFR